MRLASGDKAPAFIGVNWNGENISLADLAGSKVWLAFFRYASCPLCNLRVNQIIHRYDELAASGLKVVAVFQSEAGNVAKYVGKQQPPFPLIADPKEEIYSLFGVEHSTWGFLNPANILSALKATFKGFLPGKMEGTITRLPADFLIGADGVIRTAFFGTKIADHIPFAEVEAFIAKE
ncbi:MAG: AhpC/TSA family protein [Planctomycetes bacterium]|nr:AhpC/TSA family protein [Planctomycetota bacterium]